MTIFKRLPRGGYFIMGIVVVLLLVPTVAGAGPALQFMGIEGTSGNEADVTNGGQLLTTVASPGNTWTIQADFPHSGDALVLPVPPSGDFNVLTELQINTFINPTPGTGGYIEVYASPGGIQLADVNPGSYGDTTIPFSPGQPIPYRSGMQWGDLVITIQEIGVNLTASGYFAPCSEDEAACS